MEAAFSSFLIYFSIIVLSATVMTYLFNRLRQPSILAFILTGILIGPIALGIVPHSPEITMLSKIGIAFLLFSVGLGTDLNKLKKLNLTVFALPVINIVLTFILLILFKNLIGLSLIQSLYLSFIISFSSTMLVAKILIDNFEMGTFNAQISIGILLVEDLIAILAIPILGDILNISFILVLTVIFKVLILIALAYILNRWIYPRLIKHTFRSTQGFFLLTMGSCFLFILISQLLKFDIAVGAFIGGLAISIFPYNLEISNNISGIRSLLSMIFFVSLGMQLTFHFESGYLLLIILFVMVFVLKPLIHFVILIFSGYGTRISVTSSLYLAQISEFSLILAMQGLLLNHLTSDQYSAIVIVTSVSMLLTPYITEYHDSLYRFIKPLLHHFKKKKYYSRKIDKLSNIPDKIENHLILVGSDVVGDAILKVLSRDKHIPIVIIDQNPEKIAPLVAKKINCICGDVTNEEIIHSMNIDKARLVVSTIPRFDVTMRLLTKVKSINPKLKFYARANTNEQALKLYEMGADLVILPKVLESNFLLEKISIFNDEVDNNKVENASFIRGAYVSYLKREVEQEKKKRK